MGADRARDPLAFDNERWSPAQAEGIVDLPAFFIARHEVTVAEFTKFAQAGKWAHRSARHCRAAPIIRWRSCRGPTRSRIAGGSKPTLKSSPATPARLAQALTRWLARDAADGSGMGKSRARIGSTALSVGRRAAARSRQLRCGGTAPAGKFACPECAHGLSDMAGNVWEWTRSPLQPYPYDATDDRSNLDADALWVMRGGGFADNPQLIRTTTRGAAEPGARRPFIGFRVVISPK